MGKKKKNKKIVVGFVLNYNLKNWLGGVNVIANLIKVLNLYYPNKYTFKIFVNKKDKKTANIYFDKKNIISTDLFNKKKILYYFNLLKIFIFGRSKKFDDFLIKNNVNLITHSTYLGVNSKIKNFYWIPDFQYLELKNMFSFIQRLQRHINIKIGINNCNKIILSSNHAKKIFLKYFGKKKKKKIVISKFRFVFNAKNITSKNLIQKKYNLPKNYFIVPNQFWKHKNYDLIIKSINHIKKQKLNTNILIVMTGRGFDYRSKNYFSDIKLTINKLGLNSHFKHLGVINFNDLLSIIKSSVALINPSIYEGWSSTVEQAKSLNKKMILSSIAVHKEQSNKKTYFFKNDDYMKLSQHLINISNAKEKPTNSYGKDVRIYASELNKLIQSSIN